MSLQLALTLALAKKDMEIQQKEKETKEKKEWDEGVLSNGGVTWFPITVKTEKIVSGVVKKSSTKKKIKICVLLPSEEFSQISNKGKFSFRNALGNRVFLSVKSYVEAESIVKELYGETKDGKSVYKVTAAAI